MDFDAGDWIRTRVGRDKLSPETVKVVADFTMLWNYFKEKFCATDAKSSKLRELARRVNRPLPRSLIVCLAYWRKRYFENGSLNNNFETLYLSEQEETFVSEVVRKIRDEPQDQLLAILFIVKRLRNNLFHGIKAIPMLDRQRENLSFAARALALAMELMQSNEQ